jgi:hypothetical protein
MSLWRQDRYGPTRDRYQRIVLACPLSEGRLPLVSSSSSSPSSISLPPPPLLYVTTTATILTHPSVGTASSLASSWPTEDAAREAFTAYSRSKPGRPLVTVIMRLLMKMMMMMMMMVMRMMMR